MKRSSALIPLSRDHHRALDVARRLRHATPEDLTDALRRLHAFWEPGGRRHFEIEERLLLPALPAADAEWRQACERVSAEHDRIRGLVATVRDVDGAHKLGDLLHGHVRFEERRLFELLEARLPETELVRLGNAIERAEAE